MAISRQVREGSYSATYILVFLAIIAALNYLAVQYNKTFDATEGKLFSLSDQTLKVLDGLETDATIYHFARKNEFPRAKDSLVRYENASSRVNVRYVDPDSDPALAEAMNIRTYGTTLVEVGARREEATTTSEQDVTNAFIKALKTETKKVCLLSGHGESDPADTEREGLSVAEEEIRNANYEAETISFLENPEAPSDCTLLVVAGPDKAYLEPEIDILRDYVAGGGRLLLMIDHAKSPEMAELAAEWGVETGDDVVIDLSGIGRLFGGSPLTPLVADYDSAHPITEVMRNVASFFPMARSVKKAASSGDWNVVELMKTTEASFATANLDIKDGELVRHPDAETEGPISLAAAASRTIENAATAEDGAGDSQEAEAESEAEGGEKEARVVVVGTSRFARNYFIGRGGNLDLFLNMLGWLSSDEELISIRPKDPEATPMELSSAQMSRLFWLLIVGLPLAIVAAGGRMWWLRR